MSSASGSTRWTNSYSEAVEACLEVGKVEGRVYSDSLIEKRFGEVAACVKKGWASTGTC